MFLRFWWKLLLLALTAEVAAFGQQQPATLIDSSQSLPDAPSSHLGNSARLSPVLPWIKGGNSSLEQGEFAVEPGDDPENRLLLPLIKHIVRDQQQVFLEPRKFRVQSLRWMIPVAAASGVVVASDSWISHQVPDKASQLHRSSQFSNYSLYSILGLDGGSFLFGEVTKNDHLREAGLLGGEAAANSSAIAYLLKEITQRPGPTAARQSGIFFQGGNSFPSEHSAIAWSMASVWAHEYPGTLSQTLAYGLASAVTISRVTSKQHFASEALLGSALGWYFGRQAYRAHHDPQLGGAPWGDVDLTETPLHDFPSSTHAESGRNPANMGSPDVPLDSWIYPAIERLMALGYVKSAYVGQRPWTRLQCARFLEQANEDEGEMLSTDEGSAAEQHANDASRIVEALRAEFVKESDRIEGARNLDLTVASVYARSDNIIGTPLRDSYHFGQTDVNDFGRPYGEGWNGYFGAEVHGEAGPLAIVVQGELQHAAARASYSQSALQEVALVDKTAVLPAGVGQINGVSESDRLSLISGTTSFTWRDTQVSFGKQNLWLGPGQAGPPLMSDNAEPIPMFRINSLEPVRIPLLSHVLGPMQTEFFLGQLSGHHWELNYPNLIGPNITPQPFVHGDKISFKPTPNLEFGMGVTAVFAGPGLPFTWHNFLRTYYVHSTDPRTNPGKRTSEADVQYRVPGLRNWLTVYMDSLVVDEFSPLGSTRPFLNPGIYLPQIPGARHLQFRAEGLYETITKEFGPGVIYADSRRFRDGYTNNGLLMGSWIGRAGRGGQAWLTYSFSPRSQLQLSYRHQEVDKGFIGGGRLIDYSAASDLQLSSQLQFSSKLQYEQWRFPVLSAEKQSNVTASFQLTFSPDRKAH